MTSLLRELVAVPMAFARSSTTVSSPRCASARPTARPTTPAPMTSASMESIRRLSCLESIAVRTSIGDAMAKVDFKLQDQVVVITGASQGIGAACAERLSADGAAVALWDVADAPGNALARTLAERDARAAYVHCNVAS